MRDLPNTLEMYRDEGKGEDCLMTIYKMVPTRGCWFHFGNTQWSPRAVQGGKDLSPTTHTEPAAKLDFLSKGSHQQYSASFQHNAPPTCLYEDPLWYLSIPLGCNLGEQKQTLKQIQHCKTYTQ